MVATIFGGLTSTKSRREWKLAARWVLAVTTEKATVNPSYRPWSKVPITFNRADQWADIPYIGRSPSSLMQPSRKCFSEKCSSMVGALGTSSSP